MGKTIKASELDKKLFKAVRKAVDKKAAKEIAPIVKEVYKKHAKKDLAGMKAKSTAKGVNNNALAEEAKHISRQIASYVSNTIPENGRFVVFNSLPPDGPLWGKINSSEVPGNVFAEWLVDGGLVIHPALTKYRGAYIDNWQEYTRDYRFDPEPFIDNAIEEIKTKHWKRITEIVKNAIIEELLKH